MQRWSAKLDIEQDSQCMHQGQPRQTATEMPEIMRPDAFDGGALDDLAKGGLDAVAQMSQAFGKRGLGITG